MKKLFLLLLPACIIASDGFAQNKHNLNLIKEDPEGINYEPGPPRLDKVNDAEAQYILLENTSSSNPADRSWNERPRKVNLSEAEKTLDNTPYLPKRKYDPWLKKWSKS